MMLFEHRLFGETDDSLTTLEWRVNMGTPGDQLGIVYMEARVPSVGEWQKVVGIDPKGKLFRFAFGSLYNNPIPLPKTTSLDDTTSRVIALAPTF